MMTSASCGTGLALKLKLKSLFIVHIYILHSLYRLPIDLHTTWVIAQIRPYRPYQHRH